MNKVGKGRYVDIFRKFTNCGNCKAKKKCLAYNCEVDYRSDLLCSKKIWLCDNCYNPDRVFTCKKHKHEVNSTKCEFAGQSYGHSPLYWDTYCTDPKDEVGNIPRVYDTQCEHCKITFQICKHHPRSPFKYTTCAHCCSDVFDIKMWPWIHGIRREKISSLELICSEYQQILSRLQKPDDEGFIRYISRRERREIKRKMIRQRRKIFYPLLNPEY